MHWRGDRTGGTFLGDPLCHDTELAFEAFNVAFDSLLGRDEGELSDADMKAFTDFVLQIMPPPNPVRSLDNQLTDSQNRGRSVFRDRTVIVDKAASCRGCHTLDATQGEFGTLGQTTFDTETQEFKVPQLKNLYQKVGMFGTPNTKFADILPAAAQFQGDQIRGFGFLHDGSMGTVFDFLRARVFTINDSQRQDFEQFMLAFDTTFAPIVGQQITLTNRNAAVAGPRIDLMLARATTPFDLVNQSAATECNLVAKAVSGGAARGYLLDAVTGNFRSDRAVEPEISDAQLRALASVDGQQVTYTCVPPGEGVRQGLDRDGDGVFDRDEIDNGTDPTNPNDPLETPTPRPTWTMPPTATPTPSVSSTPTPIRGDSDCNQTLDEADADATCTAVFSLQAQAQCNADCNQDGRVSVADVTCVAGLLAGAQH